MSDRRPLRASNDSSARSRAWEALPPTWPAVAFKRAPASLTRACRSSASFPTSKEWVDITVLLRQFTEFTHIYPQTARLGLQSRRLLFAGRLDRQGKLAPPAPRVEARRVPARVEP